MVPLEEDYTHICAEIHNFNEHWIEQSPTALHSSTRSLQRCVTSIFPIHICTSTNPERSCMGQVSPALDLSPVTDIFL